MIALFLCCNPLASQNWQKINKKIMKLELQNAALGDSIAIKKIYKMRNHFPILQNLNVNAKSDTIFVIDYCGNGDNPTLYFTAWNKRSALGIELRFKEIMQGNWWESDEWKTEERKWDVKNSGILTFDPQKSSHDRFLKLYAERWDFSKIREGERLAGPPQYILSPSYVYLTRVIFKSKRKIQYDCVRFLSSGISEAMWKESGKGY